MKKYRIDVHGCDDTTTVYMALDKEAYKVVKMLCEAVTETSTYKCEPTMVITELRED